ncbi:MAG: ABC transporter ATP-binding protein [Pyrinomonadaceae bacterium]
MSASSLIEVTSVTKRYGPVTAVKDLSLNVSPGEIYGLVGANGAGKSTLIRMIAGLTAPDQGEVRVCGQDVARTPAVKRRLGYLPEELFLYERLTGREYLELVAGLKEVDPLMVERELEFFGLQAKAETWIGGYSLGMRKSGLAAALWAPDVLMLDEPLNGLDVEMMRKSACGLKRNATAGAPC